MKARAVGKFEYSNGLWQSFVIIGSCNHLISIKQEKKPVNRFLQDGASAGIRSLQIIIEKTLLNKVHGTDFREKRNYAAVLRERLLAI